jgi:uncharacterized membrane protein
MLENFAVQTAHIISRIIELTGIVIIAFGAFATLIVFLYSVCRREDRNRAIASFRSSLGRAILLGLEFLVAADIINTVAVEPTLNSVAVLAGIVAIRTFLSFSLDTEIEGHWPWRRGARRREV